LERTLELVLKSVDRRLEALEERVGEIPDPFVLYYKEPGASDYVKVNEALDDMYGRINILETLVIN
jgi:hypothetical protein